MQKTIIPFMPGDNYKTSITGSIISKNNRVWGEKNVLHLPKYAGIRADNNHWFSFLCPTESESEIFDF